jgi:hypothetical protein
MHGPSLRRNIGKNFNTGLNITAVGYLGCKVGSENVSFSLEECELTFTATGEMVISLITGGKKCGMTFTLAGSGCVVTIPEQTVSGLAYTTIKPGEYPEVTMTMTVTGTKGERDKKCTSPGSFVGGEIKGKARLRMALAAVVVAAGTIAVVTSAGAHVPAQFSFPKGAKEVNSRAEEPAEDAVQEIVVPGLGTATCTGVSYWGLPEASPTTSISLGLNFESCEFLGQEYRLFRRACQFVFNANGTLTIASEEGGNCVENSMWLTDEDAKDCSVTFPEQVRTGVTYTNISKNEEVTATMVLKGLEGERSEECAVKGNFNTGEFKGKTILFGYEGATKKPMTWSATVP